MPIVRGLISLAEARTYVYTDQASTAPTTADAVIEDYVSAATPVIENLAGRLVAESVVEVFDGGNVSVLFPFAFNTVTTVVESGQTITDFVASPAAGVVYAGGVDSPRPFRVGRQNVTVTVAVGFATIPPEVKVAAGFLIRHWWQNGRQGNRPGFGNDPSSADAGAMMAGVPTRRLMELLQPRPNVPGFA